MSAPATRYVDAAGRQCRVWEKGSGPTVYWLASTPLLYRWTAIHEALSAQCHLVVLSLPGMAGNSRNHEDIDDHLSWCLAARDLLEAAGFQHGDTLMGSSTAGALAADVAALWPDLVGRLILVAPHGMFVDAEPTRDMFGLHPRKAAELMSAKPDVYKDQIALPEGMEPVEWTIETARSNEATARFLWPLGNTRVAQRLGRITATTLILWGTEDQIIPPSYADHFATGMGNRASVQRIPGAGHVAELDQPEAIAKAVLAFAAQGSKARPNLVAASS